MHMSWYQLFHLGDPMLTLPLGSAIAAWLLAARAWRAALGWTVGFGLALGLVAATKIAFMGWATGLPALAFKAVSGHATGFTAVFPTLCYLAMPAWKARARRAASAAALALAAVVAAALVHAGEHTLAEAAAGWAIGAGAFLCTARLAGGTSFTAVTSLAPAAIPDTAPSLAPDAAPDAGPSLVPAAAPDAGPFPAPRTAPDAAPAPASIAATAAAPSAAASPAFVPTPATIACAALAFLASAWLLRSAPLNWWMIKVALLLSGNSTPVPWGHCG